MNPRPIGAEFEQVYGPSESEAVVRRTIFLYRVIAHNKRQQFPKAPEEIWEQLEPVRMWYQYPADPHTMNLDGTTINEWGPREEVK